MAEKFCVTITHCRTDGDKATLGFVVANAAQGSEKETMIFLSCDGVYCAVKGEAEKIDEGPHLLLSRNWLPSLSTQAARYGFAPRA